MSAIPNPVGFLDPLSVTASFGITEGMQIADFGCGAGEFAVILAKIVGESGVVNAIDIIESRLESVRAKAKFAGLSNIRTVRSNLEVIGSSHLADYTQDVSLLANILFQNPKKINILQEAHRVLKTDGRLIIIDWKESTGTLGPPAELKTDADDMKTLVSSQGFVFERDIDAGVFHYGFIFKKANHAV